MIRKIAATELEYLHLTAAGRRIGYRNEDGSERHGWDDFHAALGDAAVLSAALDGQPVSVVNTESGAIEAVVDRPAWRGMGLEERAEERRLSRPVAAVPSPEAAETTETIPQPTGGQ